MEPSISPDEFEQRLAACRRDYERIKAEIDKIGFICEGSLVERFIACGKPNCRCVDPGQRHGPYWQLSWKQAGKTVSRRLSTQQARLYQEWIANRRQLDALIRQLHDVSRTAREHLLDQVDDTTATTPGEAASQASRRR